MTSSEMRRKIDSLWTEFWTGGITNPLTVIEQITYLIFCRMLDQQETNQERIASRGGKRTVPLFNEEQQKLRWHQFKALPGNAMLPLVRDEVFKFLREMHGNTLGLGGHLKDAQCLIPKDSLLVKAVTMVDELPIGRADANGDLYEYLLSKLTTAGINGQFRTPRHIIKTMVELLEPKPTDVIGDPACGTAGFMAMCSEFLLQRYTSPEGVITLPDGSVQYSGDKLEPYREHIRARMFHGFDFDVTMLRIASMNMLLHGVSEPCIHYQDALSGSFSGNYPQLATNAFDLILANPPFKGNLDGEDIAPELSRVIKSTKTELLFVARMVDMLKLGGRCAVIVPDGVLFGSSGAHVALRKLLVDENQLEAVISLPAGVFRPYAGVSTGILVFTKGGKTNDVFFFDVQGDGLSLDDKRQSKPESNDLPLLLATWRNRNPKTDTDKKSKVFFVGADEIRENKFDLSLNRYKERDYVLEEYDPPLVILERMEKLEEEIMADLQQLREMLG